MCWKPILPTNVAEDGVYRLLYFRLFFLVFCSILLQSTVFEVIEIGGVKPDLVLIWVILMSLLRGSRWGAVFGALSGILLDILAGRHVGLNALALFLTGLVAGQLEGKVFKENYLVPIGAVFVGTIFHALLMALLGWMAGLHLFVAGWLRSLILYSAVYNTVLVPFVYGKFYRFCANGMFRAKQ
ncbi:MAG: rod shape-determining protein MreD [Firmicutes bacterium]|nr:rod shape-determining protein MreD [Bacillota bacterium]